MSQIEELIKVHKKRYPLMEEPDVQKLLYQSRFGGGHLIKNEADCFSFLKEEWQSAVSDKKSHAPFDGMPEPIGSGLCRYPLCAVKDDEAAEYLLRALCRLFIYSARLTYRENAPQPVRHSQVFREAYRPAYRVLHASFVRWLPVIAAVERLISENGKIPFGTADTCSEPLLSETDEAGKTASAFSAQAEAVKFPRCILALDGMCGAGKTSFANLLSELYGCSIIRADDFFLPPALRTETRLSEAGGNIHYERFTEEIVKPLAKLRARQAEVSGCKASASSDTPTNAASNAGIQAGSEKSASAHRLSALPSLIYRRFDCSVMDYRKESVYVPLTPLLLIEGSYCMRPEFREIYDISVFLECSEEEQQRRILNRNGADMLRIFQEKWIPMENNYFRSCNVKEACNYTVRNKDIDKTDIG